MQGAKMMKPKCMAEGGLVGGIKSLMGFGAAKPPTATPAPTAAPASAPQGAISQYAGMTAMQRREKEAGLKDGGVVHGPGTGTSDSIHRKVKPGTYILPKDSTDTVKGMGARMPKKMADGGKVPVRLSNGETQINPEMVHKIGTKVLDMVRGMTHKPAHPDKESRAEDKGEPKGAERREMMMPRGAIRKMADGGLLDDQPKPMPYAEQMRNVGNALTSAPVAAFKTLVSAPGYGFNAPPAATPAPAPVTPNPADQRLAAGTQTPQLGALAPSTVATPTTPATPATPSNYFGNAPATDATALMARGPASAQNLGAMGGIQARQDAGDAARANQAQYDQEVADANRTNARQGFGTGTPMAGGLRGILEAQMSGRRITAKGAGVISDLARTDAQTATATAANRLAQDKLGVDKTVGAAEARLKGAQATTAEGVIAAQARLAAAKTPDEVKAATENLRVVQGREHPNRYTVIPGGQSVDSATGQPLREPSTVLDNQTGQIVNTGAQGAARTGVTPKAEYDKLPKGAKYTGPDGKQYTKG